MKNIDTTQRLLNHILTGRVYRKGIKLYYELINYDVDELYIDYYADCKILLRHGYDCNEDNFEKTTNSYKFEIVDTVLKT